MFPIKDLIWVVPSLMYHLCIGVNNSYHRKNQEEK